MFPPGRYGRRREPRKRSWALRVAAGIGVVLMLGIAFKLYQQYGKEDFSPTVLRYSNVTTSSITVTFDVQKQAGDKATCTLQAFAYTGEQLGEAQVPVAAGTDVRVTYTLPTTAKAYVAEIPSCQPAD